MEIFSVFSEGTVRHIATVVPNNKNNGEEKPIRQKDADKNSQQYCASRKLNKIDQLQKRKVLTMKKSLKIIATTTASTLLASMATSCGTEETQDINRMKTNNESTEAKALKPAVKLNLRITHSMTNLDANRCGGEGRCVVREK
jgi:hypothetical protein